MKLYPPIAHFKVENTWRVHVHKADYVYTIKLSNDLTRVFTERSVPSYIQTKIVMADATYEPTINIPNFEALSLFIYRGSYDDMANIAWRYDDTNYVVVLPQENMNSLHGEQMIEKNEET